VPTGDRHRFIPATIRCFLAQTFEDSELLILDDGVEPCDSVDHPRIRYLRQNPYLVRQSTGAKRNNINSLASGEIIVHFDDDDWSAPERITHQLAFMEKSKTAVVGYHTLLYWRELDGKGFQYSDPQFRPHAAGTTLCYTKAWWAAHPFQDVKVGEDFQFCIIAQRSGQLASCDSEGMVVARAHGANSCVPAFGTAKFKAVSEEIFPKAFFA
jgi:hypothetical protein